jgi:Icc-related predicted phosphoesterase
MLDHVPSGMMVGCEDLFNRIAEVKPKIHASGHIHHARGAKEFNDTLFINASICTERYDPTNKPFVVEFDSETKEWEMVSF